MCSESRRSLSLLMTSDLTLLGNRVKDVFSLAIDSDDPRLQWAAVSALIENALPNGHVAVTDFHDRVCHLLISVLHNYSSDEYNDIPSGFQSAAYIGWYLSVLMKMNCEREKNNLVDCLGAFVLKSDKTSREPLLLGLFEHAINDSQFRKAFETWESNGKLSLFLQEAGDLAKGSN